MIKNIFFDFDGVIADQVNVKTEAFAKLYKPFGEDVVRKVIVHHKANGGMSRYEKFKLYHKQFLGIELNDKDINKLAEQFSLIVKQGVIESPEVKGAHDFLKKYRKKFNMFIITGTPTEESIAICKVRGIYDCFEGIYGSPQKKDYWSNYILTHYHYKPEDTIFVGDALADYRAAKNTNLTFYLREYEENIHLFEDIKEIVRFKNFEDFETLIIK